MAASRRSKKTADQEFVASLAEQVSNDERTRHEREPLGFEDQMPGPVGPTPEDDPRFRPTLETSAHPYGGLPTHEGYDVDPDTHFRRRRNMIAAAVVLTVVVAVGWVAAVGGSIVPNGDPDAARGSIDETRQLFQRQFEQMTARLGRDGATTSTSTGAAASLNTALESLRTQLKAAATTTSTTSTAPAPR